MLTAEQLRKYSYFENMSINCLTEVATRVETILYAKGAEIIRQNSPADYLFFLKSGEVEITQRTRHGQNAKITTLKSGDSFGEMAFLTCSHRNNTVTALTEVTLLRLSRRDFDAITMMDSSLKSLMESKICEYKNFNHTKTLQPLALLAPEKSIALMEKFTEQKFKDGDDIILEGDPAEFYYIIKDGRASIHKAGQRIGTISIGDGFGEESIIRDQKRNATITAIGDTTVLALDKKDFNDLLKKPFLDFTFPEAISEAEMGRFVFIDARVPIEYEEEHILGAMNIPLEILRDKFIELDPEREYLTYCTNDSRGMAAAFLMSTMGFNARNLRGGLSGWEGPLVSLKEGIYYPEQDDMSEEEEAMLEKMMSKK